MDNAWNRIEAWLTRHAPEIKADLQAGASDPELGAAAAAIGNQLPEEMIRSYRIHNGSRGGAAPLFGDWRLLSLAAAITAWKGIETLPDDDVAEDVEDVAAPQIK